MVLDLPVGGVKREEEEERRWRQKPRSFKFF